MFGGGVSLFSKREKAKWANGQALAVFGGGVSLFSKREKAKRANGHALAVFGGDVFYYSPNGKVQSDLHQNSRRAHTNNKNESIVRSSVGRDIIISPTDNKRI